MWSLAPWQAMTSHCSTIRSMIAEAIVASPKLTCLNIQGRFSRISGGDEIAGSDELLLPGNLAEDDGAPGSILTKDYARVLASKLHRVTERKLPLE